jgi:hypothetical protein
MFHFQCVYILYVRIYSFDTENLSFTFYHLVIKKEAKLYRRIASVDVHVQFQFNPNYWSSHLALYTSMMISTETTMTHYNVMTSTSGNCNNKTYSHRIHLSDSYAGPHLTLKNLHSWSTYDRQSIDCDSKFRLLSILYTLDSVYLILTFADLHCHCGPTLPITYFDIHHSMTLQHLHRFQTQLISHVCPTHMCRNFLTPIISVSSARIAFCTSKSNDGKELQVSIVVLPNQMNLKSLCRRTIREYLYNCCATVEDISKLFSYRLNQYIQYRPEYQ